MKKKEKEKKKQKMRRSRRAFGAGCDGKKHVAATRKEEEEADGCSTKPGQQSLHLLPPSLPSLHPTPLNHSAS